MLITALDSSVLNVAIPTILRDFHTDLPSLQWVLTGYSLTFSPPSSSSAASWATSTAGAACSWSAVVGGFLTTFYSWRWAFGINVIATPLAIVGSLAFMPKDAPGNARPRLDLPGAAMIAAGMFAVVFGLSGLPEAHVPCRYVQVTALGAKSDGSGRSATAPVPCGTAHQPWSTAMPDPTLRSDRAR